jgi:glycosyltransferase involved in cell wall biosynthesis
MVRASLPRRGRKGNLLIRTWHLITGEYPPDPGGVSDYTATLAGALAAAGRAIHVWCPGDAAATVDGPDGVAIHRVAGRFGPAGLTRLDRELDRFPGPRTLLVQYVPHAFGWKAMNLPLAIWILGRRIRRRDDIRVMFHEVAYPWVWRPMRHNILAAANRLIVIIIAWACSRAYISTQGWEPLLKRLGYRRTPTIWAPVPSNVPESASIAGVAARRAELTQGDPTARVACHFGTYGPSVTQTLGPVVREMLAHRPHLRVLLLGAGGDRWRAELAEDLGDRIARVFSPGLLPSTEIAEYLRASDLALQPYPDGASGRRTTLMAALANGVPVVTTVGILSEPIWSDGAVAVVPAGDPDRLTRMALDLLDHPARLTELGQAGRQLYEDRFAIRHTVATLLDPP